MWKNIKRLSNFKIDQENKIHNVEFPNTGFISQPMNEPEYISNIPHSPSVFIHLSAILCSLRSWPAGTGGPKVLFRCYNSYDNDMLNISLVSGVVPNNCKSIRITPIPKSSGPISDRTKFRPIANAPVLLIVLESCALAIWSLKWMGQLTWTNSHTNITAAYWMQLLHSITIQHSRLIKVAKSLGVSSATIHPPSIR